jgi:hypothetical protein
MVVEKGRYAGIDLGKTHMGDGSHHPGAGLMTAFAFCAFVNEARFENGTQAGNYLGLTPAGVYVREPDTVGRDNEWRRNGYLQALPVQEAWALARSKGGGALKERFEYMTKEKGTGKKKAIAAIARRLGVLLFTLLKNGTVYEASVSGRESLM